jgi:hypothetical protein
MTASDGAVQEKLAEYKRKLGKAFVTAEEAWQLQNFCTSELEKALIQLHTPTVSSASSESDDAASLTDPEWLHLMRRSPQSQQHGSKFAAQQEHLETVKESVQSIVAQIEQLLKAATQIAALRVCVKCFSVLRLHIIFLRAVSLATSFKAYNVSSLGWLKSHCTKQNDPLPKYGYFSDARSDAEASPD